jgi:predicted phosphohydrolase
LPVDKGYTEILGFAGDLSYIYRVNEMRTEMKRIEKVAEKKISSQGNLAFQETVRIFTMFD